MEELKLLCMLIIVSVIISLATCKDCLLHDTCSCGFDDGSGQVDLTSLGTTDNTPRFKDVKNNDDGYYYSYNPCGGFTEGDCTMAAACVLNDDKTQQQQIGNMTPTSVRFSWDDDTGNVLAAYTAGSGVLTLTTVTLICDPNACTPEFIPQGEQGASQFALQLTTICACPGRCTSSGPVNCGVVAKGGLSGGSILLLVFFCVLIIYAIAGVAFNKVRRKATGKDLIPHRESCTALPGLIATGFRFTFNTCLRRKASYDEI